MSIADGCGQYLLDSPAWSAPAPPLRMGKQVSGIGSVTLPRAAVAVHRAVSRPCRSPA
ncbi:hypothetical protein [Xanthomonas axonopodis]|uniref:hypothetical protein n=1 Tax=Xanthomonas axonopodis TaxID=53413 RepID=UPI000AE03C66